MITTLRRWIARAIAIVVFVVTFGRLRVAFDGVQPSRSVEDPTAIGAPLDPEEGDPETPPVD